MKRLSGELVDLKDWAAYLADILSKGKRDVTALKILILLAVIVIPGGILLSTPGIYQGVTGVLSPISGFFPGLIPGASNITDDNTHTGNPGGDIIPPWITGPGANTSPTIKPSANPSASPGPGQGNNNSSTITPVPTADPTAGPTAGPTPGPTGTPMPTKPVADFTGSPLGILAGEQVTFTDQSIKSPTSWAWNFGDGSANSTLQNPAHTYATAGDYSVTLTATNAYGSHAIVKTGYVHVFNLPPPVPIANFAASPTSVIIGQAVTFTDQSTNSPMEWAWNFGDGSTNSTLQNPTHAYGTAGVYTVMLTATSAGGSNTLVRTDYITVSLPPIPVADFSGSPTSIAEGEQVAFTDASTNTPTSWSWDFGDGGTSTLQNPAHTYSADGDYTVTLTASNAGGSSSPVAKTAYIHVSDPGLAAPVAGFTASPDSGTAPLTVTFTDTSTGTIDSFSWDFNGDGTADDTTDRNPSYTYSTPGTYTATLTVTNAGGSSTHQVPITVTEALPDAPVANFETSPTSGTAPLTVTFTDTSTGTIDSFSWDFNGDDTADDTTDRNPSYTYSTPGTYTATLTVTNAGGSSTHQVPITVT